MSPMSSTTQAPPKHYTVEIDHEGCPHCGAESRWTVVGDDIAIGQSFNDVKDAEELAEYMNEAFERGKAETAGSVGDPQAQRIADLTHAKNQMEAALIDMRQEARVLKDTLQGLRKEINAAPKRTITVSVSYQEWLNKLNLD